MNTLTNESHKTKFFEDIDHSILVAFKARIKAIKGMNLYDPV